jgi:hypothetical protein
LEGFFNWEAKGIEMLKVILTVDCEKFISFRQISPRWGRFEKFKGRINSLIKKFRYNENGFDIVYSTFAEKNVPVTLMLVGKIFSPKKSPKFISWGYHTLNHLPLTLLEEDLIRKEVKNVYRLRNFCAPLWMIEDVNSPEKVFDVLREEEYKNIIYKGEDDGPKNHSHKLNISRVIKRNGLNLLWVSNNFEGNSSEEHLKKVMDEIEKHHNEDKIYLLTTHDFTHKDNKNLVRVLDFLKKLEEKNKIRIESMENIK